MEDAAERAISDVRQRVSQIESDLAALTSTQPPPTPPPDASAPQTTLSEAITQALLQLDNIHISRESAAEALRNGDRQRSARISVLLARRKTLVRKLNALGDRLDSLNSSS
ncbi:hypothetical protein BWQ96_00262 [Gracilariopsis chorda]|uniref:BAG domain-containing protein n=1 Tax=Gracilariopsis chorda TaxID=448386 RepID=A0A2V3J842_9FLOR|nr:hypothetical protein BWQ96_00262 [Gracilariopsis chorda]|eukprot:PXF50102.1 hypothetical protein BWQ96_00262 [Gracilariopsis chorda]